MKDEEMAEEYCNHLQSEMLAYTPENPRQQRTVTLLDVEEAFLAGLKAGRPQWHDLKKDPTDLPKRNKEYVVKVKEYGGISVYIGRYWKEEKTFTGSYLSGLDVIKWKEIE